MVSKEAFSGSIEYIQILDKDGNVDEDLEPDMSDDELKDMYWYMLLARTYDEKAIKLQRQGRMG
ncbi:MAG: pyruvate dehydrogenase (acetyl-transferring) E1 component subunit alpha, partial [Candidatus Nanohaloarchaea archaeon]|nr:pyruvate dehydrogenase (acetyl-transferring) E1 component subunit alpha [Candidatus Nanohaloarchaea archaeon]